MEKCICCNSQLEKRSFLVDIYGRPICSNCSTLIDNEILESEEEMFFILSTDNSFVAVGGGAYLKLT